MARNRKAAEAVCLDVIESICPGNPNVGLYRELFDKKSPKYLNDAAFHDWMERLRSGQGCLVYVDAPGGKHKLKLERNIGPLAKKYDIQFFQQIWYTDESGDVFLTPNAYLILPWPVRRQAQLLVEKISIPESSGSIDDMTGQVTGSSKGSKLSFNELSLLKAFGLKYTITEFMKYRGGDVQGLAAMNQMIRQTGRVSQEVIEPYSGRAQSSATLKNILLGMHLDNTL